MGNTPFDRRFKDKESSRSIDFSSPARFVSRPDLKRQVTEQRFTPARPDPRVADPQQPTTREDAHVCQDMLALYARELALKNEELARLGPAEVPGARQEAKILRRAHWVHPYGLPGVGTHPQGRVHCVEISGPQCRSSRCLRRRLH